MDRSPETVTQDLETSQQFQDTTTHLESTAHKATETTFETPEVLPEVLPKQEQKPVTKKPEESNGYKLGKRIRDLALPLRNLVNGLSEIKPEVDGPEDPQVEKLKNLVQSLITQLERDRSENYILPKRKTTVLAVIAVLSSMAYFYSHPIKTNSNAGVIKVLEGGGRTITDNEGKTYYLPEPKKEEKKPVAKNESEEDKPE